MKPICPFCGYMFNHDARQDELYKCARCAEFFRVGTKVEVGQTSAKEPEDESEHSSEATSPLPVLPSRLGDTASCQKEPEKETSIGRSSSRGVHRVVFATVCAMTVIGLVVSWTGLGGWTGLRGHLGSKKFLWKDGFLTRDYDQPIKKVNSAIQGLFGQVEKDGVVYSDALVIEMGELKDEGAYVTTYGVGGKNGKWGNWNKVKTIDGLAVKEGGCRIQVKIADRKDTITVGFKVDDGDKALSETLHDLFAQGLAKTTD